MSYTGTVVVIPTRNRATIAMNAIRSVLDQPVENVNMLVSDNSTWESDREALAEFCSNHRDERLHYMRPRQPLPMTPHWEWAIQKALQFQQASHFLYLTDRMMFRKGALKEIVDLATLYPAKIISYNHDRIVDDARPIRIDQYPTTEKLVEVETTYLSWLVSQAVLTPALPRMLNCIVPQPVLLQMQQRFGNIFSSIAPDFHFCCRCLDMEDSILFYDKSSIFHYALDRSNGASVTRGEMTVDNADFTANLPVDDSIRNYATPIPQLKTTVNASFNEYLLFKRQTDSPRFFDLDLQKYLQSNANEIAEVIDPALRNEMLSLLAAKGYQEATNNHGNVVKVSFLKRLESWLKQVLTAPATTPAWVFLARTLAIRPPGENQFEFATLDEAIYYAQNISRGNVSQRYRPEQFLKARELPKQ